MEMGIDMAAGGDQTVVWSVDRAGVVSVTDRLRVAKAEERLRVDAVKRRGSVPDVCGSEIPVAPARGPVKLVQPVTGQVDASGDVVLVKSGYQGRAALRCVDAFDLMQRSARRQKVPMFLTDAQIAMGREYAALYERYHGGNVKGSSFGDRVGGSGDGGRDVMDARLADRERLKMLQGRVGDGVALAVRRVRPSRRGSKVRADVIRDRDVVQKVCVEGMTIKAVLVSMGWHDGKTNADAVRKAFSGALDRMSGPAGRSGVRTLREGGERPLW